MIYLVLLCLLVILLVFIGAFIIGMLINGFINILQTHDWENEWTIDFKEGDDYE